MKDQAGSSLKKNTEFKLKPSRQSRYYMAITDDFLEFGGNSVVRETTSSMRQEVRIITARTNKAKIPNQRKLELLALNQNLDESLKTMRINIEKCMAQANFNSKVQYELTRLHIKIEGNVITELQAV